MSIEGLDYILNKQEVVPTVSALDMLQNPERVEADYLRHVRTYVPISRLAEGQEDVLSVVEFEKRVIKAVTSARAPRGYLTAEYGYGKTSSALYLWQKAEKASILAVPPFQMQNLPDLVTATYGWMKYRIQTSQPFLVGELDRVYASTIGNSLEKESQSTGVSLGVLQHWSNIGRFIVDLQPVDYITFFEKATDIAIRAGYEGILILPDEIQQYIEPQVQRSEDPIGPLFNLIQMLATRERYLRFGMIMVIPLKEIGVIRNARGRDDLLQRMRELSLDLTSVYDQNFAANLWGLLATEFEFADLQSKIVAAETLSALGEIASRDDLSNGPRTIINAFRRIVERYRSYAGTPAAYTPIDLVDDLIAGAIPFSGNNQIQNVTRRALQNAIVHQDSKRFEPAIKLAAAFPTSGVPIGTQQKYGVAEPLDSLMQQAIGELVIAVGPTDQHGVTLYGLQVGIKQTDWLSQTIREFRRSYGEQQNDTKYRAVSAFSQLLKMRIFNGWTIQDERSANLTTNQTIIFEGEFPSIANRFPKRRVHVRILWEDEERKDSDIAGDVAVEFRLSLHQELRERPEDRRSFTTEIQFDYQEHTVVVPINLMYVRPEGIPKQIQLKLQDVWSPYELSPLVLMSIYHMLDEKRERGLIPRGDDGIISNGFQPELMDSILRDLLNSTVGSAVGGVSQGRIVETIVEDLLNNRYGTSYRTLMATNTWRNALQRYSNAIALLNNPYQQRGEVEVEGTKKQIAEMLTYSNPALDNFLKTFPDLLTVVRNWKGEEPGSVRFTLHDLETRIMGWLRSSDKTERMSLGSKQVDVHCLDLSVVFRRSRQLGYQNEETEELIKLLGRRNIAVTHQTYQLREVPSYNVDLDAITFQLEQFGADMRTLRNGFPKNEQLISLQEQADRWRQVIEKEALSGKPDPQRVYNLGKAIQVRQEEVGRFAIDRKAELLRQLAAMRVGLHPMGGTQLTSLESQIVGAVGYVDQVNAIRRSVLSSAHSVKAEQDKLNAKLERTQSELTQLDVSYQVLARAAGEIVHIGAELERVRSLKESFDINYRYMEGWRSLVADGSSLSDMLQQISRIARQEMREYEDLSREISGRVSSTSNKLNVLPDYALYTPRIQELLERVRIVRQKAENDFIDLQNRYVRSLTEQGFYQRDQLGRPLMYNVINPEESYRLLFESTQDAISKLTSRLQQLLQRYQSEAKNILATPLIANLTSEERDAIETKGNNILQEAAKALERLESLQDEIIDIETVKDFPTDSSGKYGLLIADLTEIRDITRQLAQTVQEMGNWLSRVSMTDEEQLVYESYPGDDGDVQVDIVDWINRNRATPDIFWKTLRGLHEKRYITVSVSRVRR